MAQLFVNIFAVTMEQGEYALCVDVYTDQGFCAALWPGEFAYELATAG